MKKYLNKYVIGIALVIIFLCLVCQDETVEDFMCQNCGKSAWRPFGKDERSCAMCDNCGWCINESGEGSCVEGGPAGPLFRRDCVSWSKGVVQPLYTVSYPWYNPMGWWPYYSGWGGYWGRPFRPFRRRFRRFRRHHHVGRPRAGPRRGGRGGRGGRRGRR